MEKIRNLNDLLIEQAQDIYNANRQLKKEMDSWREKINDQDLKHRIVSHADELEDHLQRLRNVFDQLDVMPEGEKCEAMEGLIKEANHLLDRCEDPEVIDAAMITSLQRINHYEIAAYGSICSFAKTVGKEEIANKLHPSLVEEKETDKELKELAQSTINQRAMLA